MTGEPAAPRDLDRYQRAYADHPFEDVQARMRKRMLLELLDRLAPRRVLEVGCDLDTLANHWRGAERFTIIEPGADFAAEARSAMANRSEAEVIEATLEAAAPGLAGGFDLVILSSLLHEVADPGALLHAAGQTAAAGGLVHVNVPNGRSVHRLLAMEMGLVQAPTELSATQLALQQQRTFPAAPLAGMAEAPGFQVAEAGSYFVKPFTHRQMQDLMDQGLVTAAMLEGFWGLEKHMPGLGSEIFVNLRPVPPEPAV